MWGREQKTIKFLTKGHALNWEGGAGVDGKIL